MKSNRKFPLVSVIIPTYNSAEYIERTINSVLKQTYQNFEIIIVDDFSSDFKNLSKVIENYSDNRIKLFRLSVKKNGSVARNFGVGKSKGDFIAFLDSDDEWFPKKLEKIFSFIYKYADTDFLLYHKAIIYGQYRTLVRPKRGIMHNERVSDYNSLHRHMMTTCSYFLPRKIALKLKWDERLERHQDTAYCLYAESLGVQFVYLDVVLTKINWNSNLVRRKNIVTWKRSYKFYLMYSKLMTIKSGKRFLFDNVVLRLFRNKKVRLALLIVLKYKLINETIKYFPTLCKALFINIILKN